MALQSVSAMRGKKQKKKQARPVERRADTQELTPAGTSAYYGKPLTRSRGLPVFVTLAALCESSDLTVRTT